MKCENVKAMFQQFCADWPLDESYYIWGAGNSAWKFCTWMKEKLNIAGIVDNDSKKWGSVFGDYIVEKPEKYLGECGCHKIIVASYAYSEIIPALEERGLKENIDFCDSRAFLGIYKWQLEHKIHIQRTDVAITSFCNLRCKKCNMLIPYYKHPAHKTADAVLADLDVYFRWVDYVENLNLLGGEPFLHPDVLGITQAVADQFGAKIGTLVFFTNGTIVPKEPMLSFMGKHGITVQISDYRHGLPQVSKKVDALVEALTAYGVPYRLEKTDAWLDFNRPQIDRSSWGEEEWIRFCDRCHAPFRGLQDKKFYFCHLNASAVLCGTISDNQGDYFSLDRLPEEQGMDLVAFDLGYLPNGYVSYCRRCGGCTAVNQNRTAVAEQL